MEQQMTKRNKKAPMLLVDANVNIFSTHYSKKKKEAKDQDLH